MFTEEQIEEARGAYAEIQATNDFPNPDDKEHYFDGMLNDILKTSWPSRLSQIN